MFKKILSLKMLFFAVVVSSLGAQAQNGLNFDGTDDYVSTNYTGISGTGARTVEAWIKVPATNTVAQRVIVDWGAIAPNGSRFTLNLLNNMLRLEVGGSGLNGTTLLNDNSWHHVAATYNPTATNKVVIYLDGAQQIAGNLTLSTTSGTVKIGTRVDNINNFNGTIDEVRIWDVARTQAEISASKDIEFCVAPANLKAYYKFNQGIAAGANATVLTVTGSAGTNSGTLNGFALTGATSNWVTGAMLSAAPTALATLNGTTLTANLVAGATYQWLDCGNANAIIPNATAQTYTPTVSGSYAVKVTNAGGCSTTSACIQVNVCNINSAVILSGTTLTVGQANATYQWIDCANNNQPIDGANAQSFTPTVTGNYAVIVSTPNNCTATSACIEVLVCNVNTEVILSGTMLIAAQQIGGASYQWIDCANNNEPIDDATQITYTPPVSGNYAVIITLPNTCTATSECTYVCNLNDDVTLNGTTLTATQENASYQWIDCANNNEPINDANGQAFTPTVTGSYAVIISTPDNCTITSGCTEVLVCNVNAGVNNNAGTLMAVEQAGASYQWIDCANNNEPIDDATGVTFMPTVSGNYAVIISLENGCTETSDCTYVCALTDAVTLNGTTLTAAQENVSYQWIDCGNNNEPINDANGQTFTATVSGSYAVIISTPDNCTVTSECQYVLVCNLNDEVANNSGTLTAVQEDASYQWINCADNEPINDANAQIFTPTATGAYAVIISTPDNCTVTSDCMEVEVEVAGTDSFSVNQIQLYPNPVSSTLTLANPKNLNIESLTVTDMTGKLILSQNNNNTQINVEQLPVGMYFLNVSATEGVQHLKFIKE